MTFERILTLLFAAAYFAGAYYAEPLSVAPAWIVVLAQVFFCIVSLWLMGWHLSTYAPVQKLVTCIRLYLKALDDIAYAAYDQALIDCDTPEAFKAESARLRAEKLKELHQRMAKAAFKRV